VREKIHVGCADEINRIGKYLRPMSDEKALYWLSQVIGWFGYILLILFNSFIEAKVDAGIIKVLIVNFALGIGLSHLMRFVILRFDLLRMKIYRLLPRLILLSVVTGFLASLIYGGISDLFFKDVEPILVSPYTIIVRLVIPFITFFMFWNIIYFAAIYLKNYEREEVKNLRLTASMNEVELNNLRAQMNPHFIFNALNSIRALIDENPQLAKRSVTQMSHILRNSLSSGKRKFISVEEEMKVVADYLELEKIRYEERLDFEFDMDQRLSSVLIPPLLIQTLVENAIKHGISQLPEGGKITVSLGLKSDGEIRLSVINTGKLRNNTTLLEERSGIGLANSKKRLALLYGERAKLDIYNRDGEVVCDVILPLKNQQTEYENSDYR
jgi:sensor histidine kinase YesM